MMQFDNKTRNPVSRGRPPTGSMKHNAMFALARDGTRWRHNLNATKGADRVVQLGRMLPLPMAPQKVQDEVVIFFDHRRMYTIRFPEIEYSWIPGSGFRFYCSGFKDPPERKGFSYYACVEKPPNMEFQSRRKLLLITTRKGMFRYIFWRNGFRSARDWVNVTCSGEYSWKPGRDNYTSSISASDHKDWYMNNIACLMTVKDPDSSGAIVGKHWNSNCLACYRWLEM